MELERSVKTWLSLLATMTIVTTVLLVPHSPMLCDQQLSNSNYQQQLQQQQQQQIQQLFAMNNNNLSTASSLATPLTTTTTTTQTQSQTITTTPTTPTIPTTNLQLIATATTAATTLTTTQDPALQTNQTSLQPTTQPDHLTTTSVAVITGEKQSTSSSSGSSTQTPSTSTTQAASRNETRLQGGSKATEIQGVAESSKVEIATGSITGDIDLESVTGLDSSKLVSRHGRASFTSYNRHQSQNQIHQQQEQQQQQQHHGRSSNVDPYIVCYLGSWSTYRPSLAKFTPENIDPFLCTHIIYAFATLSSKFELKSHDPYNDITQGGYKKFTSLKDYNKQLKTLIAVGGWNEGSARFSKLVGSSEMRSTFIASTIRFLRQNRFDGLDLDWEYPAFREGSHFEDKANYAQLIKEMRQAFDKEKEISGGLPKLLLSIAVPAGQDNIDNGFDVASISKNVDFMNVLTYDYYTAYDKQTNHHAPLRQRPGPSSLGIYDPARKLNVEWTVNYYIELGADPGKLVVGVPTYGRSYTLAEPVTDEQQEEAGLGAAAEKAGDAGPATRENGYLAYYEICQKVDQEEWTKSGVNYKDYQGPVAYKGNQWVSYDDIESVIMKTNYVLKNKLGGVMVWTLDNDDFRGSCPSSKNKHNPLITAIRDTIIVAVTGQAPHTTTTSTTSTTTTTTTTTTTPPPPPPPPPPSSESQSNNNNDQSESSTAESSQSLIRNLAAGIQAGPTTPDPGVAFECKDEGFFPNPKDCKKYFWCLDSGPANLGVVAHAFTCPSGLFFNTQTEGCDYPEKVACRQKSSSTSTTTTTTTSTTPRPSHHSMQAAASSGDRDRDYVSPSIPVRKKPDYRHKSKTTTTSTTTTTTPPPPTTTTTTTTTTTAAPTTTMLPTSMIPVTNDINELVASMLQNPHFANVIAKQLGVSPPNFANLGDSMTADQVSSFTQGMSQNQGQFSGGVGGGGGSSGALGNQASGTGSGQNSRPQNSQTQDLLQLLNLIQSLGGVEKIAPYLTNPQQQQQQQQLQQQQQQQNNNQDMMNNQEYNLIAAANQLLRNESLSTATISPQEQQQYNLQQQQQPGRTHQRRPQQIEGGGAILDDGSSKEPFVFNYNQPPATNQRQITGGTNNPQVFSNGADALELQKSALNQLQGLVNSQPIDPMGSMDSSGNNQQLLINQQQQNNNQQQDAMITNDPSQLSNEIMQNLAQLESLFAYNQPGRGSAPTAASQGANINQQQSPLQVAPVPITSPMLPEAVNDLPPLPGLAPSIQTGLQRPLNNNNNDLAANNQQQPVIRVRVPQRSNQVLKKQPQSIPQQQQPPVNRQQQPARQQPAAIMSPYIESTRQGSQRINNNQAQNNNRVRAQKQQLPQQQQQFNNNFNNDQNFLPNTFNANDAIASSSFQGQPNQFSHTNHLDQVRAVAPQAGNARRLNQQQQQQQQQQPLQTVPIATLPVATNQQQQQRRRPPNRAHRVQSSNGSNSSHGQARNLVLLSPGPPNNQQQQQPIITTTATSTSTAATNTQWSLPAQSVGSGFSPTNMADTTTRSALVDESLADKEIEAKLRLLENEFYTTSTNPTMDNGRQPTPITTLRHHQTNDFSTDSNSSPSTMASIGLSSLSATQTQTQTQSSRHSNIVAPVTASQSTIQSTMGMARATANSQQQQALSRQTPRDQSFDNDQDTRDAHIGLSMMNQDELLPPPPQPPNNVASSTSPSISGSNAGISLPTSTLSSVGSSTVSDASLLASLDNSGPGVLVDPTSGKLTCTRRGVFAHPGSCGQFIVCAPQSRSLKALRPFEHHCPAEQIFHDSFGRCRPKSLQNDLTKFCLN